jgi:hypothetical protein
MNLPRLYLCGPMTGLPDFNAPAFQNAAKRLRGYGLAVFNPTENGLPVDAPWADHMRKDIAELVRCFAVATLPGIEYSRGAQLELHIAHALGLPVGRVDDWLAGFTGEPYPNPTESKERHSDHH